MCGIAGLYRFSAYDDGGLLQKTVRSMANALAHRGPDGDGIWQDPDVPLLLAHRRLAIIDLSPDGAQPMVSSSGRYVITFNGEIYNFLVLQEELENAGHAFRGRSDTEILLAAVEHWGLSRTLQKISGMFAFALWDRKERKLHLARDRFGKKPLYVGWAGDSLLFASELKAFHACPDFVPEINRDALALYMRHACVCAPYSIFHGVWQLLPGARIVLDFDSIEPRADLSLLMEPYWFLPRIIEEARTHITDRTEAALVEEFDYLLQEAVAQRMLSDVPLGAFLSGGIDSSTVVAIMQKLAGQPVQTFSIGFDDNGIYDEAPHAASIAAHLGTVHREFYVSGHEALDVVPHLPDIYDEPFADASQIPTYLICKHAREAVTVALTGDGGDEILAGYERHFVIPALWSKIGFLPHPLRQLGGGFLKALPETWLDRIRPEYDGFGRRVRRAGELIGLDGPEEIYTYLTGQWLKPEELVLDAHEPLIPLTDPDWQAQGLGFAERMIYGDTLSYRTNDLMVKTDRAGMAVALEARAPLMDHRLMEYCWTLPHKMKVRGMRGKWLLRQVLKRYVPEDLFDRPKRGFGVPMEAWLRGPLKEWGQDLIHRDMLKAQGYLNADMVCNAWMSFQAAEKANPREAERLWTILMFQAWQARWMK